MYKCHDWKTLEYEEEGWVTECSRLLIRHVVSTHLHLCMLLRISS